MNISFFNPIATSSSRSVSNSLPSNTTVAVSDKSVEQQFLDYAKMSPIERMRANILKSMNLTEGDVKAMSPDEQQKVENLIKEKLTEMLKKSQDTAGTDASSPGKAMAKKPSPSLSPSVLAQMLSIQAGQQSVAANNDSSKGLLPSAQSRDSALNRWQ